MWGHANHAYQRPRLALCPGGATTKFRCVEFLHRMVEMIAPGADNKPAMVVVARDRQRWVTTDTGQNEEGCHVRVNDGENAITGAHIRPSDSFTQATKSYLEKLTAAVAPRGTPRGDLNARSKEWDRSANPRGKWLAEERPAAKNTNNELGGTHI